MINENNFQIFKTFLKEEALEVVLDKNNYINSLMCAICDEFEPRAFLQRFHLFLDENRDKFITLHSKCVFKDGVYEKLDALLQSFNYISTID